MPPLLDLEATDVSELSWEELVGQSDPDHSADNWVPTSCVSCVSCTPSCLSCLCRAA